MQIVPAMVRYLKSSLMPDKTVGEAWAHIMIHALTGMCEALQEGSLPSIPCGAIGDFCARAGCALYAGKQTECNRWPEEAD